MAVKRGRPVKASKGTGAAGARVGLLFAWAVMAGWCVTDVYINIHPMYTRGR